LEPRRFSRKLALRFRAGDARARELARKHRMSWTFQQSTGILRDWRGLVAGIGYSGSGPYKNRPTGQSLLRQGPIPQGLWDILGPPENTARHGSYVLRLQPYIDTKTFSRDGFLIHGDSVEQPGTASEGYIVLPYVVRKEIWESGDLILRVVA
jgi:hypothetical protein